MRPKRQATYLALLNAAIEVLENDGEAAIRIRDLVAACGVTSPILYQNFGSREGLIIAAQSERYARSWSVFAERFIPDIDSCNTASELRDVITRVLESAYSPERMTVREVRASVLGSAITRPALLVAIKSALAPVVESTADALRRAQQRGIVSPDLDIVAATWWYLGQIDGRLLVELLNPGVDPAAWNRTSVHAVCATLFDGLS